MQKICSLLLMVLAGQSLFAGKKEAVEQEFCMRAVMNKYDLTMPTETNKKHKKSAPKDPAFQALITRCKELRAENEQLHELRIENQKLKQLLAQNEKHEQLNSTDSSPSSIVAISPTNEEGEHRLLSPDEMHLLTPESRRVATPVQSCAHPSYYYEYPSSSRGSGMASGIVDCPKADLCDVYYLPPHSYCP